jgi:sulfur-carrier protein adenylyltransferase/sulfurtransferase
MIRRTSIIRMVACLGMLAIASWMAFAQDESASPSVPRVKADELKQSIESKAPDILVVSNDPQESYDEGHIPGAVSFPWVNQLKPPVNLPRNKTLILYCSCAHEEDALDMAAKLARLGYRNAKVLDGGFLKWVELKYPIETK